MDTPYTKHLIAKLTETTKASATFDYELDAALKEAINRSVVQTGKRIVPEALSEDGAELCQELQIPPSTAPTDIARIVLTRITAPVAKSIHSDISINTGPHQSAEHITEANNLYHSFLRSGYKVLCD